MFDKSLRFFLQHYKINYTLFFLLYIVGFYAYTQIPKEVTSAIEPSSVSIRGSYSGASVDTLNMMAVSPIEQQVKNIIGVSDVTSVITPGRFSVILELENGVDKTQITNTIQDSIAAIAIDLPSDMKEPAVRSMAHSRSIMHISMRSSTLSRNKLKALAKELKTKLLGVKDVSDVTIFGDSDLFYEILIDEKKVAAYGLDLQDVINIFSELSYIFPLGQLQTQKAQYFIATQNDAKSIEKLRHTILNINDKQILLQDIATLSKRYADASTLASMNGKNAITLAVSQNPKGDAITISKEIRKLLNSLNIKDVTLDIKMDRSNLVKERLNVVFSNILLGIFLITILTIALINYRIALVIALGIPTSFIIAAIYFYLSGYSININSLIGVLLAIGIIVDDAIVVSENIQQYIEKGYSAFEAAYKGTKEVAKPVIIASITTIFSFIPLLMLSGRIGEIIKLIPIAFSALVIASLIESFIFLPLHAKHLLKNDARTLSWAKAQQLYLTILRFLAGYKKSVLVLFVTLVPALLYYFIHNSRFVMFERFDAQTVTITFKADPSVTLTDSLSIIQTIEKDILRHKNKFFVKNISSTAGYRRSATGTTEMYPYVGYLTLELYKQKPQNFLDKYITPYISFYYDPNGRIREKSSKTIAKELRQFLRQQGYKKRFHLTTLAVVEKRLGHTKADIRIGVVSTNHQEALKAVRAIEAKLSTIKGIKYFGDNIQSGSGELKIELNDYAHQLGITQKYIGSYIASLYLNKKIGTIFDGEQLLDIKVRSINSQSDLESFKQLEIPLKHTNAFVKLEDIATVSVTQSLERLTKDNGESTFFVFANVDFAQTTASQAFTQLKPLLEELKRTYKVRFKFKGEREQKRLMQHDLFIATILAVVLIFLALLYLFDSFVETLIVMSVIPFSLLGVYMGHAVMGLHISLPSLIGALGLAGVIVNDGIIMMATIKNATSKEEVFTLAARRLRAIILTSITTLVGLTSLIFFATAESVVFQPLAVSMGFGLLWGTILNLFYLPLLYLTLFRKYPHPTTHSHHTPYLK